MGFLYPRSIFRLLSIGAILIPGLLRSQVPELLISQGGTHTYCHAVLYDSGGPNGNYGNNENHSITFCPGVPGDSIQIAFGMLDLAIGDVITLFDGTSTSAPVLASSVGTPPLTAGYLYTATSASGCITIQFNSNSAQTDPGWVANIQCSGVCPPPTANFPSFPQSPYLVCPNEPLALDASGSTAAPGRSIASYAWTIGGVTTYSATPQVDLPTNTPGQYPIGLLVRDDIGCPSTNSSVDLVRIGTKPDFSGIGIDPGTMCAGETATLNGVVQGTHWSSVPDPIVSGLFLLPVGCPPPGTYTSVLNVSGFPAGTTVNGPVDILDICLNMEHSYLGDISVSMSCPGGQSVLLFSGYGGGGGGTYLGSPLDNSTGIPGTGFEYCFSASAAWGTIVSENTAGNHVTAGTPPNNSMAPGTYTSQQSFNQWNGCPLNGPWTITVTDNLCIDDGYIFDMSMSIDPSLYPNVVQYTPVIGQGCDSSAWSGPDIVSTSPDCNIAMVAPSAPGPHPYTYTVTDDFGCTYDTTLTLNITPGVQFDVTSALPAVCGNPVLMQPGLILPLPTGAITYQWSPSTGLSSSSSPFPTASPTVPTWYTLHAFPAGHPLCGMVDSVLVQPLTTMESDSVVTDILCHGDGTGSIQVFTTGDGGPWNYTWTDNTGTVVQTTSTSNGDTFQGAGGTYKVVISEGLNGNGCADSLMATINEPPLLMIASSGTDTIICRTGTAVLNAAAAGGTAPLIMHWDHGVGIGPAQSVSPLQTMAYSVFATDAHNCYSDTSMVVVTVLLGLDAELVDTVTSCPRVDVMLQVDTVFGGNGQYSYDWGTGGSLADSLTVNLRNTQNFCVTIHDGCETPAITRCATVAITPVPPMELSVDSVLGCEPFTVHFSMNDTTGGATADWNFGYGPTQTERPMTMAHVYAQYGTFDLRVNVHWPNGCSMDSIYSNLIKVIDVPHADFNWTPYPATIFQNEVHFHELATDIADTFEWDLAGMDSSFLPDPVFTFPDDLGRNYPVRLIVRNYLGCADTIWKLVNVEDAFLVYVPTAFTPDGDGLNEVLNVVGNDIADHDFHFMVFDRWGEKIYDTTDRHAGWDGKMNGKVVKNGVYTWLLRAQSVYNGVNHDLQGHVTVVR